MCKERISLTKDHGKVTSYVPLNECVNFSLNDVCDLDLNILMTMKNLLSFTYLEL